MNPEKFPDKTFSELQDEGEWDEDIMHSVEDDMKEMYVTVAAGGSNVMLSRMFEDDVITFREYIRLTNWATEYEREHGTDRL